MKKLHLIILMVFGVAFAKAQDSGSRIDRVEAYKVGYLTEKLDLSAEEATKFWPVYNKYEDQINDLRRQERRLMKDVKRNYDDLSESQAKDALNNLSRFKTEMQKLEAQRSNELQKIMSSKKVLALMYAEMQFQRELLRRLRDRDRDKGDKRGKE